MKLLDFELKVKHSETKYGWKSLGQNSKVILSDKCIPVGS